MFCWPLTYVRMSQPQLSVGLLSLEPASPLPPHPTPLGGYRAPAWDPWVKRQIRTGYLFHMWSCKWFHVPLSFSPTLCFLPLALLYYFLMECTLPLTFLSVPWMWVLFATSQVRLFSCFLSEASSPILTQSLDLSTGPLCVPRLLNRSRGHQVAENGTPRRLLRRTRLFRERDERSWVPKTNICPTWRSLSSLFSAVSL